MPTEAEREELKHLFGRMSEGNQRLSAALARIDALEARWTSFDDAKFKEELYEKLDADGSVNWSIFSDVLGLSQQALAS
ncbi:hypothetical protein [Sphingomonas sp.]|jgi:hypothetical protein|uniref:hypothetical protein n=1 Tax=Sphingomonas sp. TaxID=28214 RepID=UPI002DE5E41C|nr:hypothetical protein [Sphingomonas sp.]